MRVKAGFLRPIALAFLLIVFSLAQPAIAAGEPDTVRVGDHVLRVYYVPYLGTADIFTYQYDPDGVDELTLYEYHGNPADLDPFDKPEEVGLYAVVAGPRQYDTCDGLDYWNDCDRANPKTFVTLGGMPISYYDCPPLQSPTCHCIVRECDPFTGPCTCDHFVTLPTQRDIDVTIANQAPKPRYTFCGRSTHPNGGGVDWSGDALEYACFLVDVAYYGVDNDESYVPSVSDQRVDTVRDESWDYYGTLDSICNSNSEENPTIIKEPGDYGDRCTGVTRGSPAAGFCVKDATGVYEDGVCWDGYCGFAVDNQTTPEGNEELWDKGTLGYVFPSEPPMPESINHFCTGWFVTGLHVATFCADMNETGSWDDTRANATCANGLDDDSDTWFDEFFRWTNERECVECNDTHHIKNNCTLFGTTNQCDYLTAEKNVLCEWGCGADEECDEIPPETENADGVYCDEFCLASRDCPHADVPEENDTCYQPEVYNWGNCSLAGGGPNQCHSNSSDSWCSRLTDPDESECYCMAYFNLTLDIGFDDQMPWEWHNNSIEFNKTQVWDEQGRPEEEVVGKLNKILSSGCTGQNCGGCILRGEDCLIPFVFENRAYNETIDVDEIINGTLNVTEINFSIWQIQTVDGVGFLKGYPFSSGARWNFAYDDGGGEPYPDATNILMPVYYSGATSYSYTWNMWSDPSKDAMQDAMWRLLLKLDDNSTTPTYDSVIDLIEAPDGSLVPFNKTTMWFTSEDFLRTMSLRGPIEVKLVVWI